MEVKSKIIGTKENPKSAKIRMDRWRLPKLRTCVYPILHFVSLHFLLLQVKGQHDFPAPPPTVWIDRHWSIPEDEPIGTRVAHAKASEPTSNLEFGLEPSLFLDGSSFFRIDAVTGAIYLNESMQGKKGNQYYVVVTANNGQVASKTEVWVQITPPAGSHQSSKIPNSPFPPTIPKKPGGNQLASGISNGNSADVESKNGQPTENVPIYPPLKLPPNAILPALPPQLSSDPVSHIIPKVDGSSDTSNGLEESTPTTFQPLFPPHILNSNTNHVNLLNTTDVALEKDPTLYTINPATNDLVEMESSRQTVVNVTKEDRRESSSNSVIVFTIVPLVLIFGVIPIVIASIWLVRRRTRVKKRPTKEMRKESAATTNSSMTMSTEGISPTALMRQWIKQAQSNRYESWNPELGESKTGRENRWEFPRHHLQVGRILGEGCFGQVWQCEALNIDGKEGTTTVAVKTLKEGAGERERADLLSELAVMKMLDPHPHVVRLLGACTEKDPTFLIMEYVALGKLQSYLRNSRSSHYYPNLHADSNSLSSKDLTAFCYQTARGMEYLSSKGIVHRDIAARNVLVDKDRICKVADFGFARDIVANHVYERKTDGRLPVRWMAPEALYDNIFTTKTDIWSFGVLMWEVVTLGSTPYPGISAAEVMRRVREGYRLEKPDHCRRELYNIMYYCWAANPEDRPTFSDLVNFLKHLLFSETDYIELDRFPDHDYYNYMSSNQTSGEKL